MIPPELLQELAEKICREAHGEAAVLGVFQSNMCELVVATRPDCAFSLAEGLRKMANEADGLDSQIAQRSGANQPGDVFQVNERAERWVGVLVQATEIRPWGIVAHATVPVSPTLPPVLVPIRLNWPEVNFIGRTTLKTEKVLS